LGASHPRLEDEPASRGRDERTAGRAITWSTKNYPPSAIKDATRGSTRANGDRGKKGGMATGMFRKQGKPRNVAETAGVWGRRRAKEYCAMKGSGAELDASSRP